MPDPEYAVSVLNAISARVPLNAAGFQVNAAAGGNVARLVTTILRARLRGSQDITSKSTRWGGGVIVFKNYMPKGRFGGFWTWVTQNNIDGGDGLRAWVCSGIDAKKAVLHVWVIPFSMIREHYANFREDRLHRKALIIIPQKDGWSFRFAELPSEPPELGR
jgi:hypothetical protein